MQRLHITVRPSPFKQGKERKYNGLKGTLKFLSRPNFRLPFETEMITLEIVTECKLRLLERPTISHFFFFFFFNSGLFTG